MLADSKEVIINFQSKIISAHAIVPTKDLAELFYHIDESKLRNSQQAEGGLGMCFEPSLKRHCGPRHLFNV